ncbi:uncharacterized protein RCO7_11063 [Rhynchosporium graminicola]|uniref:Uncharacterized protein n=1 Tax=Rhynchosporium graminicola TaxID=2792576 RepID=A0A1E1KVN4_9HELO|nr:uncharacterized protein RCO7_11063 [Rhynchosporium commune]
MSKFAQIHVLKVNFTIFGALPVEVWASFPTLEKLSIIIYPYDEIRELEHTQCYELRFIKPQRGSIHGNRAGWVLRHTKLALGAVDAVKYSTWPMPEIEVLVRKAGKKEDRLVDAYWTDDVETFKKAKGWDSDAEEDVDHDSDEYNDEDCWYPQAKASQVGHERLWSVVDTAPPTHTSGGRKDEGNWESDIETEGAADLSKRPRAPMRRA